MKPANKGASINCTGCPGAPSSVEAKGGKGVKVDGETVLVASDTTIKQFKPNCIAIPPPAPPKPCTAVLSKWAMTYDKHQVNGENVLLFPNLIPCTSGPGVVTMTDAGQNTNALGADADEDGDKKCAWKTCKEKHAFNITYADNGKVTRSNLGEWIHPGAIYTEVYKSDQYPNSGITDKNYAIRRHHVIPCKVYEKLPDLSENLRLLGYDINNEFYNGMACAYRDEDVVWHNLQPHRGNHQSYSDKVKNNLTEVQTECLTFCSDNKQIELWETIQKKVKEYREEILNWNWELLGGATAQRDKTFMQFSDQKKVPQGNRKYFI